MIIFLCVVILILCFAIFDLSICLYRAGKSFKTLMKINEHLADEIEKFTLEVKNA